MKSIGDFSRSLFSTNYSPKIVTDSSLNDKENSFNSLTQQQNIFNEPFVNNNANRLYRNFSKMSPDEKYMYMNSFNSELNSINESMINPEKTLREANKIINDASFKPMMTTAEKRLLNKAIRVKSSVQKKLDKVA